MSNVLSDILIMYPLALSVEQVQLILGGERHEVMALLESEQLKGRHLDDDWVVLQEHVLEFLVSCRMALSGHVIDAIVALANCEDRESDAIPAGQGA